MQGLGDGSSTGNKVNGKFDFPVRGQIRKFLRKNINKLAYDRHVVRSAGIRRFHSRLGDKTSKKNRATRTNKITRLKERQHRLTAHGETTSKGVLGLSNGAK